MSMAPVSVCAIEGIAIASPRAKGITHFGFIF